jgi:hypothetical protein
LYLLSHFLFSHYPPYLPSYYFSQKPPFTYLPISLPACLPASLVFFPTSLAESVRRRKVGSEFSLNLPFTFSPFSYCVTIRV